MQGMTGTEFKANNGGAEMDRAVFARLVMEENIKRNLRKSPEERVETLMVALRETERRGWWPKRDRKAQEERWLSLIP